MWRRHLKLLFRFTVVSFRNFSEFRVDFLTSIFHNLLYQGIFIIFWKSIMDHLPGSLGDWTFPELAVLSSFTLVATAVMQWFVGLLHLPRKVVRGEVDKYLCRPVSALFALVAEEINALVSLHQLSTALLILVSVCFYFDVPVTFGSAFGAAVLLLLGSVVVVLIQGCVGLSSFWLGEVGHLNSLLRISSEFERYPLDLFPILLQRALVWVIPIGLISTFPVLVLLGEVEILPAYLGVAAVLAAAWGALFATIWRRALVRYESFGG